MSIMKNLSMTIMMCAAFAMGWSQTGNLEKESGAESGQPMGNDLFGAPIDIESSISDQRMADLYAGMDSGDTLDVAFRGIIKEVCQVKGCWMRVQLPDGQETMVRFKDYGFFVPLDSGGKEVVVGGRAFVEELDVETRRHYARDAGLSEEAVAKITDPKKDYALIAAGVAIRH